MAIKPTWKTTTTSTSASIPPRRNLHHRLAGQVHRSANALTARTVTYKGKNSLKCAQSLSIWNYAANAWVQLSSNSVGTTEVKLDKSLGGTRAHYVSGTSRDGEVLIRVRCTSSSASFTSMGDLLRLGYS